MIVDKETEIQKSNRRILQSYHDIFEIEQNIPPNRNPRTLPEANQKTLEKITLFSPNFTGSATKSDIENQIFFGGKSYSQGNSSGELGTAIHEATGLAIKHLHANSSANKIERAILKNRKLKKLTAGQSINQKDLFPQEKAVDLDESFRLVNQLVQNISAVFGEVKKYERETSFITPINSRRRQIIGFMSSRADLSIRGSRSDGIVDLKTGSIYSEKRLLFNLAILALQWTITKTHTPTPNRFKSGFVYHSQRSLTKLDISPKENATLALIWPDFIVTNHTFRLTSHELILAQETINDWILCFLAQK